jgi:hypothetical protein
MFCLKWPSIFQDELCSVEVFNENRSVDMKNGAYSSDKGFGEAIIEVENWVLLLVFLLACLLTCCLCVLWERWPPL